MNLVKFTFFILTLSEAGPTSRYYDEFVGRQLKREDRAKMPFFYQMYLKDSN